MLAAWRDDPVRFAREALRFEPWEGQEQILRMAAESRRWAVRSGHKIGKSRVLAALALWWVATRPRSRVILTSRGDRQIRKILWPELRALYAQSVLPFGGVLHDDPGTGLVLPGYSDVLGFTAQDTEAMGGYSSPSLLYLVDEASGVGEETLEAIEGNLAGGGCIGLCGNPTRTSGTFFAAFHHQREIWRSLHISSEQTPNVREGRVVVPGLATREWVEERRRVWGENHPLYAVRVRGDFPTQGGRAVIPLSAVSRAVERWEELPPPESTARLHLGVDVARFGDDESVVQVRRGDWAGRPEAFSGLDGPNLAGEVLRIARDWRRARGRERPLVKVDVIGVGASVYDVLVRSDEVETVAVNVSERATAEGYALLRDQLWFGCADWLGTGGAIPDDARLQSELVAPEYDFDARGRQRVESKEALRKRLPNGHSPDRADALCLAVYEQRTAADAGDLGAEYDG